MRLRYKRLRTVTRELRGLPTHCSQLAVAGSDGEDGTDEAGHEDNSIVRERAKLTYDAAGDATDVAEIEARRAGLSQLQIDKAHR